MGKKGGGGNKDGANPDAKEEPSLLSEIAHCMSSLGSMQSQVVGLMKEVEHWKKQATTLEGEKKGNSGSADKLSKEVEGLKDQLKFERNLRLARPRKPDWDVMANEKLIKRILSHKDWTKLEFSKLSCVNACWRGVCQKILFNRLSEVFLFDKEGAEGLFDFLKDKPHLASIPKTINMTFKKPAYKELRAMTDVVPECILALLPMCTSLQNLKCIDLAAVVATPKLLQPLKGTLQSLIMDPAQNAHMCGRPLILGPEPHALFADWPGLKQLSMTRRSFSLWEYHKGMAPFTCQFEKISLTQCIVEGRIARMFENSANSLTVLELQAIGGVVLDDLLQVLEHCGPSLQKLLLRSIRYMNDFTDRSFDAIFARCTNIEHLNLDLTLVPVHNATTFLANQPKLAELELKIADWAGFEDWLKLFGASSKSIATATILGARWSSPELAKLEDAWKWRGVHNVIFVTRPRANDYFGSFGGPEMPALGWR